MSCYSHSPVRPYYTDIIGNPIDIHREVQHGDLYRKTEVEEIEVDELLDKEEK